MDFFLQLTITIPTKKMLYVKHILYLKDTPKDNVSLKTGVSSRVPFNKMLIRFTLIQYDQIHNPAFISFQASTLL